MAPSRERGVATSLARGLPCERVARDDDARIAALEGEVVALRAALGLLHRIEMLVRSALEVEPTCYSILTGVTAGVGLGMNRAMIFFASSDGRQLEGALAVGPASDDEAQRIWRSIEAEHLDLEALYAAAMRSRDRETEGELDARV